MYKRMFLVIIGLAVLLMGNMTNAESMGKKPEVITNVDTNTEIKTILKKKMSAPIYLITSSGVDPISGKKLFGVKLENGKFAVADDKGNVVFEKDCQDGRISKDGKKVFLFFFKSVGKPEHEGYKEEYKLIQYDIKGNEQWKIDSTLPIHLSENEKFVAEFKTWESESNPSFTLRDINGNKILWQKNDFSGRWQGYLMNDGKLIVLTHERNGNEVVSVYGLDGKQLWQYIFSNANSIHFWGLGEKYFIIASALYRGVLPPISSVYAFEEQKGLLWQKENLPIGARILGLSQNDKYCAIFKVASQELSLYEMEQGKEIYTTRITVNMYEGKIDVAPDGKVIVNYHVGVVVVGPEGKILMQSDGEKAKLSENEVLLFNNSDFKAIEFKEKK